MVNPVSSTSSSSGSLVSQYSGLMRVNGIASGMDIDGMVNQLMVAERVPLDRMEQQKQILEWQQSDYHDMNTALEDLDTTIFNGINMQSTFNKKLVTTSNDSIVSATAVNALSNISSSISVSQLATSSTWSTNKLGNFQQQDATLSFTVQQNGKSTSNSPITINVSKTDTIQDVANKITNSGLGVTAMVENIQNSSGDFVQTLVLTNNQTGSGWTIQTNDAATSNYMQTNLGFSISNNTLVKDTDSTGKETGQDAIFTLNGYTIKKSSNTFTENGISYTLKGVTTPGQTVTVSTTTDVDSIYNSIKAFVDKYNDTIKTLNDKISEERDRDYQPLTDAQKEQMTDTQISEWEDKAKTGLISHDPIITSVLTNMRQDLYSPVSGSNVTAFTQLAQIGITTSPDYTEHGKLVIDETTLREKIAEDPNAIYQLFNSSSDSYDSKGIADRLRDSIANAQDKIQTKAGYTASGVLLDNSQFDIGKSINDLNTKISDFQTHLTDVENRYYDQFSAMEQAMEQANQQSSFFLQQFSS
ncbi:flagellar hook-associated protein 2 [Heyndrickxia ginsengihumi]|uniref:flagellar hook-associated protein 2 n=1 Tax=Heyndrickxia ginsengihumi TaxID=363870 RepID=UPI003D1A8755